MKIEADWVSIDDGLPEDSLPEDSKVYMIMCLVATDKGTVKTLVRQRRQRDVNAPDGSWMWGWPKTKSLYYRPKYWMVMPDHPEAGTVAYYEPLE